MKTCYYNKEYNAIADLTDEGQIFGLDKPLMVLNRINVPERHRGKGIARKLLKQILDDADREEITLKLEILASGGLTFEQLESWYKRHGFIWSSDEKGVMVRLPLVKST